MKRIIAIFLAFCILFANTGWALTAHYCMGERVGVNLRHAGLPDEESHECSKCGMDKAATDNGCCHDEEMVIKGAQDAISGLAFIDVLLSPADLPTPQFTLSGLGLPGYISTKVNSCQPHGPPGYTSVPLFIRHCVFRI